MSELQKIKHNIVRELRGLCAHCATGNQKPHRCPVQEISARIESIKGVPLMVNNEFKGVLFSRV
jgi:hypothetical protein